LSITLDSRSYTVEIPAEMRKERKTFSSGAITFYFSVFKGIIT
jgi:hypothetical protein